MYYRVYSIHSIVYSIMYIVYVIILIVFAYGDQGTLGIQTSSYLRESLKLGYMQEDALVTTDLGNVQNMPYVLRCVAQGHLVGSVKGACNS